MLSLVDVLSNATDTPLGLAAAIVVPIVGAGIWSIKLIVSKLLERADKDRDFMLMEIEHERASLKETISTLQKFVEDTRAESDRRMGIMEKIATEQSALQAAVRAFACRAK